MLFGGIMKKILYIGISLVCIGLMLVTVFSSRKHNEKEETIVFRLAEIHPQKYPTTRGDQKFADLVKERTDGRIQIKVFHSGQLGEEKSIIEQVQFGAIDFARVSVSPFCEFAPKLNVLLMPYIFRDENHALKVLQGEIGDELLASLDGSGFLGLGWFDSGARNFYNSKREIKKPEDLKGLRIRVQETEIMNQLISHFGASVIPMGFGEVYQGLQTNSIDGAENNFPSYESASHYQVAGFYTIDEHFRIPEILIASSIVMDKLSVDDIKIIQQAALDAFVHQMVEWKKEEIRAEKIVREGGAVITKIDNKQEWIDSMKFIYEQQSEEMQQLIKRIQEVK